MAQFSQKSAALAPGTLIHGNGTSYRVERVIGSGGFGITYLVSTHIRHGALNVEATMAMKEYFPKSLCHRGEDGCTVQRFNPSDTTFHKVMKDFVSEARRVSCLVADPNIVSIGESFEANGTAYFVMEHLQGESLKDYVQRQGALPVEPAVNLVLGVGRGLMSLHRNNITHLDVKPANIILCNDGPVLRPVLIDFGLAKHYDDNGDATSTINTQAYSEGYSPMEQYAGLKRFTPQADVYALAATLLFCITGKRPPSAFEMQSSLGSILDSCRLTPTLANVLRRALSLLVEQRYATMEAFVEALSCATGCAVPHADSPDVPDDRTRIIGQQPQHPKLPRRPVSQKQPEPEKIDSDETPGLSMGSKVAIVSVFGLVLWAGALITNQIDRSITMLYGLGLFIVMVIALVGALPRWVCPILSVIAIAVCGNYTDAWIDSHLFIQYVFVLFFGNVILSLALSSKRGKKRPNSKP